MSFQNKPVSLTTEFSLRPKCNYQFSDWQAKFCSQITFSPGFISVEICCTPSEERTWSIKQCFSSYELFNQWQKSETYQKLLQDLHAFHLIDDSRGIVEKQSAEFQTGVTEVYLTTVQGNKIAEYQKWHEKIRRIEATFPGFQKVYIQAPRQQNGEWLTMLQFDTSDNLERWMNSEERKAVIDESKDFVLSRENHRLLSSFGGWFAGSSLIEDPQKWKQSALILLVLYPIVMLQFLYLTPFMSTVNLGVRTFIQNVITVILLSWPFMPLAIYGLSWWLNSKTNQKINLLGCLCLAGLYLLEVCVFWVLSS